MKNYLLLAAILLSLCAAAQSNSVVELNCYTKWAAKFEERGAEPFSDGIYEDVIITCRQGSKCICNNGKAEVVKGAVVKFYILQSDGNYEEVKRTWKNKNDVIGITNGISKIMVTVHNELFNVMWPKKIKRKNK